MKIFVTTDDVLDAVHAVIRDGFVAVQGPKGPAKTYCHRVVRALHRHDKVLPAIGFESAPNRGSVYVVYDVNRFMAGEAELRQQIVALDAAAPG
ncbi:MULTISPECIES: hypothetical protein [Lysobacter]|jgi:hypothetical protein|uniref:Uncharacterized protein n=1 Tax=Lysobacter gummosus TaxID=262324 RepID=A0ABY3XBU8_9GAMM|nr:MULTISPECIES: hypothetical protein [Lysobacter]ALN89431.1 hypothetical protein LG3211_0441 [Lysobacter gummosus]UJB18639.1 hypothetical protein L1A79_20315 [Lysobacter capsici]UJQ27636.1 hypothetical protein L2D09_19570 [Lysobacter gummosus]UNP30089.1 hypothetical protein MOV92_02030 [Lysobacter gummosus]